MYTAGLSATATGLYARGMRETADCVGDSDDSSAVERTREGRKDSEEPQSRPIHRPEDQDTGCQRLSRSCSPAAGRAAPALPCRSGSPADSPLRPPSDPLTPSSRPLGPQQPRRPDTATMFSVHSAGISARAGLLAGRLVSPWAPARPARLGCAVVRAEEGSKEEAKEPTLASKPALAPRPTVRPPPAAPARGNGYVPGGRGRGRGGGRSGGRGGDGGGRQQQSQGGGRGDSSAPAKQRQFRNSNKPAGQAYDGGRGRGGRGGRGRGDRGGGDWKSSQDRNNNKYQQQEQVTAKMKRKGRAQRRAAREELAESNKKEREDIFEVGEEGMSVEELADRLAVSPAEVVKALFMKGVMAQVNQTLDRNAVRLVAEQYEVDVLDVEEVSVDDMARKTIEFLDEDDIDGLVPRPPVVTIMGHVDHGKTSLLDFIRNSRVAAGEAGGITQRIGAYTVNVDIDEQERRITFLDTPGHEAFSAMRARGARVTDIAVIIVAADDGVRPQTLEAVAHAKAAGVPIVVAINKCDKEGAEVERVMTEMSSKAELLPEDWGGDIPMVPVSAKTGQGIDDLLAVIALMAEVTDIYAQPDKLAAGTIIEANLDRNRGPVCTLLVQNGTLRIGDPIVAGAAFGKVRAMSDAVTPGLEEAGPSTAVEVLGLNMVPMAGDMFNVVASESEARAKAEMAAQDLRRERLAAQSGGGSRVTLSTLASMDSFEDDAEAIQRLNIILKADASGTLEAVRNALLQLPQDSVMLRFLHAASGDVTTSDLDLADASEGMIVGFNIDISEQVAAEAKRRGVELRTYRVIYDLLDEVRAAMEGRLSPINERELIGSAVVKAVFGAGTKRVVAGCGVESGRMTKTCYVAIKRGKQEVWTGPITSLRRVKDDVDVVEAPLECGLQCDFKDWKEGDVIDAFELVEKIRTLEEAKATTVV